MAVVPGATEILPLTESGRRFRASRSVRLGDVDRHAQLRLDATARYLQDVAADDAADAALDSAFGWVVRRTLMNVERPARLDESLELITYCTGMGRSWAERTTVITGSAGAQIESVSVWVQVAVESGRPAPLTEQFHDIYGESFRGRKVSARLALPPRPPDTSVRPWAVRRTDVDPFNHVNNAATWAFLEEAVEHSPSSRGGQAEMEFVAPVEFGVAVELHVDASARPACSAWLVVDEAVCSAARWTPARPASAQHDAG